MKRVVVVLFLPLAMMLPNCTRQDAGSTNLTKLLPRLAGWQLAGEAKTYTHDNLFDYIDGNCELYFSYGFEGLVSAVYEKEGDSDQTVVVDIYDMGTPLNAFGVYSSMTHPDYSYGAIGCEAILSSQQIRLWQDRYQVEINSGGSEESQDSDLVKFAGRVSQNLPACSPLAELAWLPEQNRRPHTLKYVADGFLGHSFLPGGFEAVYEIGDREVRGFVAKCSSADEARSSLNKYREALAGFQGAEVQDHGKQFSAFHRYTGHVWAGVEGPWFYGAISQQSADSGRVVAAEIVRNLLDLSPS